MGVRYEYRILVTRDEVTGWLDTPEKKGAQFGPVPVDRDVLRRSTMRVLQTWLNRWAAVQQAGYRAGYLNLPVQGTFEVLGQHLYTTVFRDAVEDGLKAARKAAHEDPQQGAEVLRVLLSFANSADDLAQLPWELLHVPGPDRTGVFLAQAHRLVLSRSLALETGRPQTTPREPPLVVYFVVAVPNTEAYARQREQLVASLDQPTEYSSSIESTILDHWDGDQARKRLAAAPYPHIVHVIGVCRRIWTEEGEALRLCLDDGAGNERWVGPNTFVNLFEDSGRLRPEDRPRLVVLHLCEPSPLDLEVTFERLAPALIHQGIPAVLAMQYPLAGEAAKRFVQHLYEGLADRQSIEEAVQNARSDLFVEYEEDWLFGSPVLYMQSVDSQLLPLRTGTPAGADAGPGSVSTTGPPPASQRDFLVRALWDLRQPTKILREVEQTLFEETWPQNWPDVERILAQKIREYASRPEVAIIYAELVKAVQDEGGGVIAS